MRAGWSRSITPSVTSSRTRSRATRSATTPTRTSASIRGAWTTTSSSTRSTRSCSRWATTRSAFTRALPAVGEAQFPHLLAYSDVRDVGRAAKDWPKINFIIYHGGYHFAGGGKVEDAWAQFEKTGRIEWVTDLAEIPSKFGVSNVYADVGQLFAQTTIAEPRVSAAMMGMLVRGLGADHVVWGTDAIWTGSPQWQIEALRRLEIPEDMQKQHGFKPLGPADGPVKSTILGETNARLYKYERRAALATDRIAALKAEYEQAGSQRSNLRYGYVVGSRG